MPPLMTSPTAPSKDADLLIVLGGPIGVYEADAYPFLTREIALLERRLAQGARPSASASAHS